MRNGRTATNTVAGVGLMFISSMGSMIESLVGEDGHQHLTIIIFSVCNALSRLLMGFAADRLYVCFWFQPFLRTYLRAGFSHLNTLTRS